MVKRGDVVIISSGGKDINALVHQVNPFHEGGPSIHVSVVADDPMDNNTRKPKVMPIGYIPESVMMHDVTEWKDAQAQDAETFERWLNASTSAYNEVKESLDKANEQIEKLKAGRAKSEPDVTTDLQAAADNESCNAGPGPGAPTFEDHMSALEGDTNA